jgi:hypothetical protein
MTTGASAYGETAQTRDLGARNDVRTFTETKLGFKTSEFLMMLIFAVAVVVAAYLSDADALSREDGWRFASFVASAYIVSRGLAKLWVREPYNEKRNR